MGTMYATNIFPGDGVTKQYEINLLGGYLSRDHVHFFTRYAGVETPASPTWLGNFTVALAVAPPTGTDFVVRRVTPPFPLTGVADRSGTWNGQDVQAAQAMFLEAEARDALTDLGRHPASWDGFALPDWQPGSSLVWDMTSPVLVNGEVGGTSGPPGPAGPPGPQGPKGDPGGGGGSGYATVKVVVIGDSMAAQQMSLSDCWPAHWATMMRNAGAAIDLVNLSVAGYTYNKANTITSVYNGKTMIQRTIDLAPDVVIVNLGVNDAILKVEGRTLSQVQSDANIALTALRAGLPSAVIIGVTELMHDSVKFPNPGTTLLNKGVFPYVMARPASGILSGCLSTEMLGDDVGASLRANVSDWTLLNSYVSGHVAVNAMMLLNIWRVIRLGCVGIDGLHLTAMGNRMLAAYAFKAATTVSALTAVWPNVSIGGAFNLWSDPDLVFTGLLESSGDGWVRTSDTYGSDFVSKHWGNSEFRPETWWAPSGGSVRLSNSAVPFTKNHTIYWDVKKCRPFTLCSVSANGAAFSAAGPTDEFGNAQFLSNATALPVGTWQLRYKVGTEVFGPFQLVVTDGDASFVAPHLELRLTGDFNGSAGLFTTVPYTATKTLGAGTYSAGTYTVAVAGRYSLSHQASLLLSSPNIIIVGVYVNGSPVMEGNYTQGSGVYGGSACSGVRYLNAGDQVTFTVYASTWPGGSYALKPGARGTSATAFLSYVGP